MSETVPTGFCESQLSPYQNATAEGIQGRPSACFFPGFRDHALDSLFYSFSFLPLPDGP